MLDIVRVCVSFQVKYYILGPLAYTFFYPVLTIPPCRLQLLVLIRASEKVAMFVLLRTKVREATSSIYHWPPVSTAASDTTLLPKFHKPILPFSFYILIILNQAVCRMNCCGTVCSRVELKHYLKTRKREFRY